MRHVYHGVLAALLVTFIAASAKAEIPFDNLVALWTFDADSGTVLEDISGNGNDGELIGDPAWVPGQFGNAIQFESAKQQRVEVPDSDSLNPTTAISIVAWGYLEDDAGNRRFLQKSTPGSDNQYRLLLEWGDFKFDAGPGVAPKEVTAPVFPVQEWHHVAGVYDGAELALYIDGVKEASVAAKGEMIIPPTSTLFIGTKHPNAPEGDYWNGMIDEVAIFNVGLTEDQIKEIMNGFEKGLAVEARGKLATSWGRLKVE